MINHWTGWILLHDKDSWEWLGVLIHRTPGRNFAVSHNEGHGKFNNGPALTCRVWRSYHSRADLAFNRALKILKRHNALTKERQRKLEQWLEPLREAKR